MTSISAHATHARETARQADGKFGEQHRTDPGQLDLADQDPLDRLDPASLHGHILLADVDGEELTDYEVEEILAGRRDSACDSVTNRFTDVRDEACTRQARQWCEAEGVDFDELSVEQREQVENMVWQADSSDPMDDMLHHNRTDLIRAPLASGEDLDPEGDLYSPEGNTQARRDALARTLAGHGIDPDDPFTQSAVRYLEANGPAYWTHNMQFDVVWGGHPNDAAADWEAGSQTRLVFDGVHVALLDPDTGEGTHAHLPGRVDVNLGATMQGRGVGAGRAPFLDRAEGARSKWNLGRAAGADPHMLRPGRMVRDITPDPDQARVHARVVYDMLLDTQDPRVRAGLADGADRDTRADAARAVASAPMRPERRRTIMQGLAPGATRREVAEVADWVERAELRRIRGTDARDDGVVAEFHAMTGRWPASTQDAWVDAAGRRLEELIR